MPSQEMREKLDKELIELLNELRVALPGVQVLFAFLLVVPFSSRFEARIRSRAYMVALSADAAGHGLAHRAVGLPPPALAGEGQGAHAAGLEPARDRRASAAVAVAMTASVYLVTEVLFDDSS